MCSSDRSRRAVVALSAALTLVAAAATLAAAHAPSKTGWPLHATLLTLSEAPDSTADSLGASWPSHRRRAFRDLKPGRDMLRGLEVAGRDAWAVVRGPFHVDRSDAAWTLVTFAATGAVYAYDRELLDALHRNRENDTWDAMLEPGRSLEKLGLIGTTAPYYAAGLGIGYLFRVDPLTQMTSEALESHLVTGVLRQALERAVGRKRPREDESPRAFDFNDGDSFPSGHASVVFELATVASHHTRSNWLRALYYTVAVGVALERADSDAHWASDVIAGACLGTVVARTIVRRHAAARR